MSTAGGRGGQAVPGGTDAMGAPANDRRPLALQAEVAGYAAGWLVRLPVRAERITVTKEPFVREDVRVWRATQADSVAVRDTVRREVLRVTRPEGRHP